MKLSDDSDWRSPSLVRFDEQLRQLGRLSDAEVAEALKTTAREAWEASAEWASPDFGLNIIAGEFEEWWEERRQRGAEEIRKWLAENPLPGPGS
jgi:hypothetical protein